MLLMTITLSKRLLIIPVIYFICLLISLISGTNALNHFCQNPDQTIVWNTQFSCKVYHFAINDYLLLVSSFLGVIFIQSFLFSRGKKSIYLYIKIVIVGLLISLIFFLLNQSTTAIFPVQSIGWEGNPTFFHPPTNFVVLIAKIYASLYTLTVNGLPVVNLLLLSQTGLITSLLIFSTHFFQSLFKTHLLLTLAVFFSYLLIEYSGLIAYSRIYNLLHSPSLNTTKAIRFEKFPYIFNVTKAIRIERYPLRQPNNNLIITLPTQVPEIYDKEININLPQTTPLIKEMQLPN